MVTNIFFNQVGQQSEQNLVEDLIVEFIQIYGQDMYYLPRTVFNQDDILNEQAYYAFRDALQIDMYIKNVDSFEGDGQFLQKFGLEIRDAMTLVVARRTFEQDVLQYANIIRPREGDLIFIPMLEQAFQIKYVENEAVFFQFGALQTYEFSCELFEYSNEIFNTGIPEIDNVYNTYLNNLNINLNDMDVAITTEDGLAIIDEREIVMMFENTEENSVLQAYADNADIRIEADNIIDFSEKSPLGDW